MEYRRSNKRGGGVAILTLPELVTQQIQTYTEDFIAAKIKLANEKELLMFAIYLPNENEKIRLKQICMEIEEIHKKYKNPDIVIAGDLNLEE